MTGAEGFARSSDDVSLRRLANFSLSPALKAAFEQVYGAAFLARLLFAELGRRGTPNLFARVDFDGSIRTNGGSFGKSFEDYGFIAGKAHAMRQMETLLAAHPTINATLNEALRIAGNIWASGHIALAQERESDIPTAAELRAHLRAQLANVSIEAVVMEHKSPIAVTCRTLAEAEVRSALTAS